MLREAKQLKHRGREHRKTSRPMSTHKAMEPNEVWVRNFVNWYNNEQSHSGINYVTSEQRPHRF